MLGAARLIGLVVVVGWMWSCAEPREGGQQELCESWRPEIEGVFREHCVECHGGDTPAASYDLSSYLGVLGGGSDDVGNAIAGDGSSALLRYLDPSDDDPIHTTLSSLYPLVSRWVVDCRLAYARSAMHEPGLMNPADEDFHGRLLRANEWSFALCARCHGEDFAGGTSRASCVDCHADGPTACDTCHGEAPTSGAHAQHLLAGALGKAYDCTMCHVVPSAYTDVGHIFGADGTVDDAPAEVVFGALADAALDPGARSGPASYDAETATCTNVYCHGGALADDTGATRAPVWDEPGTGQADCGACHGLGPAGHADERCFACHSRVVASDGSLSVLELHIDAELQVGRGTGDCTDCHGGADGPAPPPDLFGNTAISEVSVGAHTSHVVGSGRLRGPIPCTDCHLEPQALFDEGHIDSGGPAEVFPAGSSGTGNARGAAPSWDRATATCADVYCHGGGALASDTWPGVLRTPVWTDASGSARACGSCHGLPPMGGTHAPGIGLSDCTTCHPTSVDSTGTPIVVRGDDGEITSEHIDGTVDLF